MVELSIIVPFYNGSKYFVELLDSISSIKVKKEIIIVDDGSKEEERMFCDKISKQYGEIYLIHQENRGIVFARNKGLSIAKGQYILFVDQDDFVNAEVIDKCIQNANKKQSDMVFWSTKHYFPDGTKQDCDIVFCEETIDGEATGQWLTSVLLRLPDRRLSRPGHIWQCLFRTQFILASHIQFKKFVDIEDDYLFVVDAISHANRILLETETGYFWRTNISSKSHSSKYIDNFREKYEELSSYLYKILLSQKVSESKLQLFVEQQQIEMCLGMVLNNCQIIKTSLMNRKRTYKELEKLKGNSILDSYYPIHYAYGFRKKIWDIMKKRQFLRVMLWADLHSLGALVKRHIMRKKYGTK